MAYTYVERKGDGVSTSFNFAFAGEDKGYIRATDIVVEAAVSGSEYQPVTGWSLSGTNQITFLTPPADGLNIRIRRVVDKNKPFAKFDRNVTLDMVSLNNSFIQNLQVVQELMDGFLPDGFFYKGNLDMGGHRVVNMSPGVDPMDAINKAQYDVVVADNKRQDQDIASIKSSLTSGVANRTVPWLYVAVGGEVTLTPPFFFDGCLLFINGVMQFELDGAFSISSNKITLSEPLKAGDKVYVLLGSKIAPAILDEAKEVSFSVAKDTISVTMAEPFGRLKVFLDGLRQPISAYTISGKVITFTEALPECTVTVEYTPPK